MREFKTVEGVFVKTDNNSQQIFNRYTYGLIFLTLYNLIYHLIIGEKSYVFSYLKSLGVVMVLTLLIDYVINIIWKQNKKFSEIIVLDNLIAIILILSYFLIDMNILICLGSILITLLVKKLFRRINLSAVLFGILMIYIYRYLTDDLVTPLTNLVSLNFSASYDVAVKNYGSILDYLLGKIYLSPLILLGIFGYLFYKKSIKYNLVITYNLTIFGFFLLFGIINGGNLWLSFLQIVCGSGLFFSIFCLSDYMVSPTIGSGQILYGFILGMLTVILRFLIPEVSTIVALIIGIFLVKWIDKFSVKLKYQEKIQRMTIIVSIILGIGTLGILSIIF